MSKIRWQIPSCGGGTEVGPISNTGGPNPKSSAEIATLNQFYDSCYTAHHLGCKAVLDSIESGYINGAYCGYNPLVMAVITNRIQAYTGISPLVSPVDSVFVANVMLGFALDTISCFSGTAMDILHDVDSALTLYDANTWSMMQVHPFLDFQKARATLLSDPYEQKAIGGYVMITKSSVDFWNSFADDFDDATAQAGMAKSDKRILRADADCFLWGLIGAIPTGPAGMYVNWVSSCGRSIVEGFAVEWHWWD